MPTEQINRIIENTSDGIIVINKQKGIEYANPSFSAITDLQVKKGMPYVDLMLQNEGNDDFFQAILDCVYQKNKIQSSIKYTHKNGSISYLKLTGKKYDTNMFVLTVTDVTQLKQDEIQQRAVSHIIAALLVLITAWIFWATIWEKFLDHEMIPSWMITYSLLLFCFIGFLYLYKARVLIPDDIGIGPVTKKDLKTDILISVLLLIIMSGIKLLFLKYVPSFSFQSDTFLNYEYLKSISFLLYPLSVVAQEFLARSWAQEAMNKIFTGKHHKMTALIMSSLLFGVFHVHKSFVYMIITPVFMFLTGLLYMKQNSIWGICIVHYAALAAGKGLGFF